MSSKSLLFLLLLISNTTIGQHFIAFRANPAGNGSYAGHAWVTFIHKNDAAAQTVIDESWGFHPVKQSLKAVFSTDGKIVPEDRLTVGKFDFVVEVNPYMYESCKEIKNVWLSKRYSALAGQNCVDFVKQIVAHIVPDLTYPSNSIFNKFPKDYLTELKALNLKIDKESRSSLSAIIQDQTSQAGKNPIVTQSGSMNSGNLLGAESPEVFASLIFRALKNNDEKTWLRCIHPDQIEPNARLRIENGFKKIRDKLQQNGLTDWSLAKFSRVTYQINDQSNRHLEGAIVAYNFKIEFTYKNGEFIGYIDIPQLFTLKNGKTFFMWSGPSFNGTGLIRNGTGFFR